MKYLLHNVMDKRFISNYGSCPKLYDALFVKNDKTTKKFKSTFFPQNQLPAYNHIIIMLVEFCCAKMILRENGNYISLALCQTTPMIICFQ